jgi:hypothetical protein
MGSRSLVRSAALRAEFFYALLTKKARFGGPFVCGIEGLRRGSESGGFVQGYQKFHHGEQVDESFEEFVFFLCVTR